MARSWDSNSSHFEPSLSTDAQPAAGEGRPTAVGRTALPCAPSVADVTDDRVFVMTANPGVRRWRALDYITQRLLPHIDGRRRVDELARSAELDPALTRLALLQLARAGVVRSVPSPSFLRVAAAGADGDGGAIVTPGWIGLPRLSKLLTDPMLAEACIQTSVLPSSEEPPAAAATTDTNSSDLIFQLFRIYAILCASPNFSIPHLISASPQLHFVDLPDAAAAAPFLSPTDVATAPPRSVSLMRLVQFGEVNDLIHRLQCYPICERIHGNQPSGSRDSSMPVEEETASFRGGPTRLSSRSHSSTSSTLKSIDRLSIGERLWSQAPQSMMDGVHNVDSIVCHVMNATRREKSQSGMLQTLAATAVADDRAAAADSIDAGVAELLHRMWFPDEPIKLEEYGGTNFPQTSLLLKVAEEEGEGAMRSDLLSTLSSISTTNQRQRRCHVRGKGGTAATGVDELQRDVRSRQMHRSVVSRTVSSSLERVGGGNSDKFHLLWQ